MLKLTNGGHVWHFILHVVGSGHVGGGAGQGIPLMTGTSQSSHLQCSCPDVNCLEAMACVMVRTICCAWAWARHYKFSCFMMALASEHPTLQKTLCPLEMYLNQ